MISGLKEGSEIGFPYGIMLSIPQLRERLLQSPEDWSVRLELASRLKSEKPQEAALLIATAPGDPANPDQAVSAAELSMEFDPEHAMRLTDRALAEDSSHIGALILRARLHQERGEVPQCRRFAAAAMMVDRARLEQEPELIAWLSEKNAALPGVRPAPVVPREDEAVHVVLMPDEPEAAVVVVDEEEAEALEEAPEEEAAAPSSERAPDEVGATWHEMAEPIVGPVAPEKPSSPPASSIPVAKPKEAPKPQAEPAQSPVPEVQEQIAPKSIESKIGEEGEEGSAVPVMSGPPPAPRKMALQKMSAFTVAVAVHAFLILLLGALAVIMPEPKVAELVGIVAPEASEEVPQNKKVVPTSMPNPAVSVSPARFVTATGISSVSLPSFEADTADPLATDIATTDLGSSFAMPFAGKGTSQVNFFGIKSAGKRVAFLIDAEKYMLTDPRGGYPAYQIVKEEIAGMIAKMGLETRFNVILFNEGDLSAFSDKLLPATAANKAKVADWLEPVNREYEKLGLRAINYPLMKLQSEVEPVKESHLRGYLRAIQCALELDVDNVFIICSGYRSMTIPRSPEEYEELLKKIRWTEKDEIALKDAYDKGREWLKRENEKRKEKGIPERVIISMWEVWRDMGLRPKTKPGGIQITPEEREDQVQNAVRLHYLSNGKPKPQINFVIFIGKDQDKRQVPQLDHFERIARRAKSGKVRVLEGLAALQNVTGRK